MATPIFLPAIQLSFNDIFVAVFKSQRIVLQREVLGLFSSALVQTFARRYQTQGKLVWWQIHSLSVNVQNVEWPIAPAAVVNRSANA